jgi:hypothetical protein
MYSRFLTLILRYKTILNSNPNTFDAIRDSRNKLKDRRVSILKSTYTKNHNNRIVEIIGENVTFGKNSQAKTDR